MTSIASPHNPHLKSLRRLARRAGRERSGRFLAEGEDLIAAARRAGRAALEGYRLEGSGLGERGFRDVAPGALRAASTLGSGARVIGVYEQRFGAPAGPLCVYLHGLRDPGNVGAVLRAAAAFGASCVALGPGCADPHSPKAVRASMGAIFAVALARVESVQELPGERIALEAGATHTLAEVLAALRSPPGGVARPPGGVARPPGGGISLLLGAEREGLPAELLAECERSARIPIATDSLNAAMAATVALYELSRPLPLAAPSSRVSA